VRIWDAQQKKLRKKGKLTVTVQLCVSKGKKGEEGNWVYCCWGMQQYSPGQIVRLYRQRFGIETKYRQLGSLLIPTSSRDERVRLLLVGVALLLLNVWEWLHSEVFSSGALGERVHHLHRLRLEAMKLGLASFLVTELGGLIDEWPTQRPLPDELTAELIT
jgi:IS4 transposase